MEWRPLNGIAVLVIVVGADRHVSTVSSPRIQQTTTFM